MWNLKKMLLTPAIASPATVNPSLREIESVLLLFLLSQIAQHTQMRIRVSRNSTKNTWNTERCAAGDGEHAPKVLLFSFVVVIAWNRHIY